jgi:hypothetical protein
MEGAGKWIIYVLGWPSELPRVVLVVLFLEMSR